MALELIDSIQVVLEELKRQWTEANRIYVGLPANDKMKHFYEGKEFGLRNAIYSIESALRVSKKK